MILDLIIMVLNIIVILILGANLFHKKEDKSKELYDKYRNQDGLLMRNKK